MLKVNEYFAGKVKSIGFDSSSIGRASVGVMAEGEYTFGTGRAGRDDGGQRRAESAAAGRSRTGKWLRSRAEYLIVPGHSEFHLQVADANVLSVPLPVSVKAASIINR